jgi:hypothetical protein
MSWDVLLLNGVPQDITSIPPPDPEGPLPTEVGVPTCSLCEKAEILLLLKRLFPRIDLSDPTWGVLNEEGSSIEFNMGDDDPVAGIMLHVRGNGDPITIIKTLCEQTGWRALDCSDYTFIDFSNSPAARFEHWRAWRDRGGVLRGPVTLWFTEKPVQVALPFAREDEAD